MSQMLESVLKTPERLERVLHKENELKKIMEKIKDKKIFFSGSGSAYNAACYGKKCLERIGIFADAKTYLDFVSSPLVGNETVTIILSVSGAKDAPRIAKHAKSQGSYTIAFTNTENSPILDVCDDYFIVPSGVGDSFINTKEHVCQLFSLLILSYLVSGNKMEELKKIPELTKQIMDENMERVGEMCEKYKSIEHFVFLSKNANMVLAEQSAIKLREVCWKLKHVEALSVDELPHGRLFSLGDKETLFFVLDEFVPEYFQSIETNVEFFEIKDNLFPPITHQQIFYMFTESMCRHYNIDPDNPRNVEIIKKFLNK